MKPIINLISSMRLVGALLLLFAFASGYATFIENDFGTQTARAEVYYAHWFEAIQVLLIISLILNILKFKMFTKDKIFIFLFHISFIIIFIGGAITRYIGYEGIMHIREGTTSNTMISDKAFIIAEFEQNGKMSQYHKNVLFSKRRDESFSKTIKVEKEEVKLELIKYISDASWQLVEDPKSNAIISLMVSDGSGSRPETVLLEEGNYKETATFILDFNSGKTFDKTTLKITKKDKELYLFHDVHIDYTLMSDQTTGHLKENQNDPFNKRTLYSFDGANIVLKDFLPHAKKALVSQTLDRSGPMFKSPKKDALVIDLTYKGETKRVNVFGLNNAIGLKYTVKFNDMSVQLSYGARYITLPFSIELRDFELERYSGSMSPSSYASEVTLIDEAENINMPYRIFMNHVLEHKNYRFFQSSYDKDERGTVLSVNHDPGTLPTYIGYLLLGIGLFMGLLTYKSRFQKLRRTAQKYQENAKKSIAILMFVLFSTQIPTNLKAQEVLNESIQTILKFDKKHAEKFSTVLVQDVKGRLKPLNTQSIDILHKVYGKSNILGLDANQVLLGMMMRPADWRKIKMIKVKHKEVLKTLGANTSDKYVSFEQFFDNPNRMMGYKLSKDLENAARKAPGKQSKYEKELIKVDERLNICYLVYTGELLTLFPKPNDVNKKWYAIIDSLKTFSTNDAQMVRSIAVEYFKVVDEALISSNWSKADVAVDKIIAYQKQYGASIYPTQLKIEAELLYNKMSIFSTLILPFLFIGLILLSVSFYKIIKPKFNVKMVTNISLISTIALFAFMTFGLALRWYVSGHAPWSNAYESLVFIAWTTMLAGFIFSKNSPMTLSATAVLTGAILFVAHLSFIEPQITNLVPVLKSYWLVIHVSMITSSYGFLGLGALLGLINLVLFTIKNKTNEKHIRYSILELNAIIEMSFIVGLSLLTIGNFLGGVWANESWGRYWGWDPKETWALVTILVYAAVLHTRFMKIPNADYVFSVLALVSYSSVIMTYFGVNFYLSGLHSYAAGDPLPIPAFVPISIVGIAILIAVSSRNRAV